MFYKKSEKRHIFLIFWIEKNAFSTSKMKFYDRSKNRYFWKGLGHGFSCQKINFFSMSFLNKKNQKETFFDILDRKECFLDLKSDILQRG